MPAVVAIRPGPARLGLQIGLESRGYGTHTMRRSKNFRAVQRLLGDTKLESTVRYLGIEVDALEMAEQTEV